MIAFHFCFDLAHFRLAGWDFYRDPFWLTARTLILASFLLLAGASLVLAQRTPSRPAREALAQRAETIQTRWNLPATKWLRVFKPFKK